MNEKNKIRYDAVLITILLVISLFIFLGVKLTGKNGKNVVVSVDGNVMYTFSLEENREFEIKGYDGGTNYLVIEDGEVYLKDASCPDLLCVHMGKIRSIGQSIICLPNRVVVEIVDGEKSSDNMGSEDEIDAIVG